MVSGLKQLYRINSLLCVLALAAAAPALQAANGDERVLAARDAAQRGDRARLAKQLDAVRGHELDPYVEYWLLRLRLEEAGADELRDFLARQSGSYLADKLRGDWLKLLGKRREWGIFDAEYPPLVQSDQEITCHALQNRLRLADLGALEEARPMWFAAADLPEPCVPLMEQLIADKRLGADDIWERLRRLLEAKKLGAAKAAAAYLPSGQAPSAKTLDAVADKPMRHLALLPSNFASSRQGREMALFAVQRTARSDPAQAAQQWESIKDRFSTADRGYAYGQLGWQAALKHMPEATGWYALAGNAPLSEEQLAWKARAALRAQNWAMVREAIEQMPKAMQAQPDWIYWLGRAHEALGRQEEARALYGRIAGQPNFYGNLADDELGRPILPPPLPQKPTGEEIKAVEALPGIRRALALFRIDMRVEGVREWNWTLRGMDDARLLAAAELARRHEIFDRAINTADRTLAFHDYSLRYLAPFREHVEPKARALQLDQGWVYGLMRQESRFITNAKSVVGAKGLMQLMPKTASWVAKKIGMHDYHPGRTSDTDVNVTLGTNYLKMVLDELDSHPVLASAAYNAGPGRARKWRDGARPLEGAIYAETIPFNETRDYVKKVMSNAVYYSALFDGQPQSLKSRLGTVAPKNGGSAPKIEDLP
ncbi:MAG: Soluble lytic murein transglycosylase [Rhodocyclaceae bacterium]|nr:MAG: lytic transglycosylase domain-containing protein [Rhodocyclaceae bacterium]MBV6406515.1 Soluble lytic murein transglycosylase [Rhodocyclaceae bacterium]CAG0943878.1 soluble lytic murein transglycosylase [Gammaproteobacteria bacterium]